MKKAVYGGFFIAIVMFLAAAVLYPLLPAQIPIHWGFNGIDAYGEKLYVFLYPCILLLLNIILIAAKILDPKKENYRKFIRTYACFAWLMNITILLLSICSILSAFYPAQIDMNLTVQLIIGTIICFMGNMMPRIRQNYFIGIKTPWALADERVWIKTHRFAGKLWFFTGIIWMITAFFSMPAVLWNILMITALIILPILYSCMIYTKLEKEKTYD